MFSREAIQLERPWHSLGIKEIFQILLSSSAGLSVEEAEVRLERYGKNLFGKKENFRFLKLFLRQIKSPLVLILIIAGLVTLFLQAYTDSIVILIAVTINTVIGILQEGKASRAFQKLKEFQKKYATVLRGGEKKMLLAEDVVPGDILFLSAGDQVAADARLVESKGLEVNESVLTGEWLASAKVCGKLAEKTYLPERKNMIWMGTFVTEGWCKALVVGTGLHTEVGKIAEMVGLEDAPPTPFQKNVKHLARWLSLIILMALIFIFGAGLMRGYEISRMFFTSVAIAVAAIPEGLPVVVSVVLAIGMERILKRGGLVKKLNAAETLGSVDIILTDKTGTLTQAIMRVSDIITFGSLADFPRKRDDRTRVLEMAVLVSDAFVENPEDKDSDWIVRGRPLEQALVIAGMESSIYSHELLKKQKRLDFLPFDSERRFAAALNKIKGGKTRILVSGAPEYILELSDHFLRAGRKLKLTDKRRKAMYQELEKQTAAGGRVVGVAYKDGRWRTLNRGRNHMFKQLIFGGFIVFHDPLRANIAVWLERAKKAGIKTVMVTGDHAKTAKKISDEVGISAQGDDVIEGGKLEEWSNGEILERIEGAKTFARVLPHQKLRIVKAWQEKKKTVAMTGDGVNDAPALNRAEVGIALNSGTEVTKEASDLVLVNDSFSVIIAAVEEGRRILINLRKILVYLLSAGFSEIILITSSLLAGLPLPILPAQILWSNLVEEGFMNFAFAFEPKEKGIMDATPDALSARRLFDNESKFLIIILSFFTAVLLTGLFLLLFVLYDCSIEYTRTIVFGALSIDSIFFAFSLKNFKKPLWKINIFSNYYLIISLFLSLLFLFGALFIPHLRFLLSLEKIGPGGVCIILTAGLMNLIAVEIAKYIFNARKLIKK